MKKIVKIAVAVMAIFAMTNFIACSTGGDSEGNTETEAGTGGSTGGTTGGETGGSTGGTTGGETGGSTGGTTGGETGGSTGEVKPVAGEYKVVYGDKIIAEGLTMEDATAMATKYGLVETTDYSIDTANKKIILTAAGMAKVEAAGGEGDHDHTGEGGETGGEGDHDHTGAGEYKVVYGDKMIAEGLTMEEATAMATECNLVKDTDYTINEETKTITLTATGMEKVAAAEGGAGGEGGVPVTVNATWNFSASPEGFPTTDGEADAITDFAIAAGEGSGATLTATGRWKFNSGLQAQATSGVDVSKVAADEWLGSASKAKYLTLTLAGDASVTVNFCGAGGADAKRFVGLLDSSNAVVWSEGSLDSAVPVTKTVKLSAGVYKIAANGSRITAITCE